MGRPPGAQNKDKPYRAALRRMVSENPDFLDQIALQQLTAARNGDTAAAREIADRLDGKVPQSIGGSDELPPVGITEIVRKIVDPKETKDAGKVR